MAGWSKEVELRLPELLRRMQSISAILKNIITTLVLVIPY
jgi:hypothetical protein